MYNPIKHLNILVPLTLVTLLVAVISLYIIGLSTSHYKDVRSATYFTDMTDFEKAEFYFSSENYDLSLARYYYEAAIKTDPRGNPLQWHQLGRIDFLEGEFDAALQNFDKQTEYFDDEIPNVYYMYGLVYGFRADLYSRKDDFYQAEKYFLTFLEYEPESPWARVDLAWIYFSQRKFEDMQIALDPVYEQQQDNPWFLNMYGLALMNTGQVEEAVSKLTLAVKLSDAVTPADWSRVYPGNSPTDWETGVNEFNQVLRLNLALATQRLQADGDNTKIKI